MFGLSLGKLIVLAILIAAVWFAFRWLQRSGQRPVGQGSRQAATKRGGTAKPVAEDTVQCPVCAVFVPALHPRACGRDACPYALKS
jgi:hypothetical protein